MDPPDAASRDDDTHPRGDETDAGESTRKRESSGRESQSAPNSLLDGIIGGVVAVVVSFIPLSTALGGAVAGYLEGGDTGSGAKVGTIAGIVAFVPLLALVAIVGAVTTFGVAPPGPRFGIVLLAGVVIVAVYIVGFGVLGAYLKREVGT